MDPDRLCMGCMGEEVEGPSCRLCGFDERLARTVVALPPRTVLHGQYLVGRILGHGGFGITYLGWDLNLEVKLAIKEYLPGEMATRGPDGVTLSVYGSVAEEFRYGLDEFLEEARALARFQGHPGIVSVVNFFRENATGYLVMSYVEGVTLKEHLAQNGGRMSYDAARVVFLPLIDALADVHASGMCHRDVSPDNVYVARSGAVKLLDFGAARFAVGEQSKSLSVVLKAGFAPEEQYRSKGRQGPWTDVYALGATMYHALTGRLPPESLDRLERDAIERPSALGVELPPHAEAALMRALGVRAADRASLAELRRALSDDGAHGRASTALVDAGADLVGKLTALLDAASARAAGYARRVDRGRAVRAGGFAAALAAVAWVVYAVTGSVDPQLVGSWESRSYGTGPIWVIRWSLARGGGYAMEASAEDHGELVADDGGEWTLRSDDAAISSGEFRVDGDGRVSFRGIPLGNRSWLAWTRRTPAVAGNRWAGTWESEPGTYEPDGWPLGLHGSRRLLVDTERRYRFEAAYEGSGRVKAKNGVWTLAPDGSDRTSHGSYTAAAGFLSIVDMSRGTLMWMRGGA